MPRSRLDDHTAAAVRREFGDWQLWAARAVVIAAALAAGLAVAGFTWICERASELFAAMHARAWWSPLLVTPLATAAIAWATRRWFAATAGSGIPQLMASLDPQLDGAQRSLFVSLKISAAKVVLTTAGLLAGLSLGREGPSVQVAGGIMLAARRWLPKRAAIHEHGLLVAGGAAGIAATFNAPLAGVMFAIEELSRGLERRSSGLVVTAIVMAGLVAVSIYGNATYFGMIRVHDVGWSLLGPGLLVTLASGVAGGLFARLLIESLRADGPGQLLRWRRERPIAFAAACGLGVAVIGVATAGTTFGSGYAQTRALVEGGDPNLPMLSAFFKFVATWLTTWSGVPAGIFAPSLSVGAALGHDVAVLTQFPNAPTLIALGMAGFLAAATQAPLTAFIIVMEMVDGHAMVLSLMACSLIASGVSRLLSRPLYATLAHAWVLRAVPDAKPAEHH